MTYLSSMELKTYKQRVRKVLSEHEEARNNDGTLLAFYIYTFHKGLVKKTDGEYSILLKDFKNLPAIENIRRSRQIIQNDNNEYLPTREEVRKARKIKEENYKNCEVREAKEI